MAGHPVGSIFLPSDFVEFTKSRTNTFFEDRAVHVDLSQPYCQQIKTCLAKSALDLKLSVSEGTYVCAEGPHLESPAQICMMRQFGDVVGMTGYPEVVLAREAQLCYASLCIVTNPACGLASKTNLCITDITDLMDSCQDSVHKIINRVAQKIPEKRSCNCQDALRDAAL
jgi:5'-methylthioadenosine phosphorylase